jgi:hypothetical protein
MSMLWEGRSLRDIREADVRTLVASGLAEHLQLEYKSALYEDNDRGRREFLLDICQFANTAGGVLLIGIPERRENGQPTGTPDPDETIGLEELNPEGVLSAYDARVMESVEERLSLESAPIDMGNGRRVLAIRVPNSTRKPHSVQREGRIYFPARRERQRYQMSVREIKELVMRTASQLEQAKQLLQAAFHEVECQPRLPYLMMGIVPTFFEDFLVNVRAETIRQAVGNFSRARQPQYRDPIYSFDGLERRSGDHNEHIVKLRRNGLLSVSLQLPLNPWQGDAVRPHALTLIAIDMLLRTFVTRAGAVYEAAAVGAPYVLGMMMRTQAPLVGAYNNEGDPFVYHTEVVAERDYPFPYMQVDELSSVDRAIRSLCDLAHQLFGREGSPSFNAEGVWTALYG